MEPRTGGKPPLSPQWAFVLQFRAEADIEQGYCEGRVEHIVSGRATHFQSLEGTPGVHRQSAELRANAVFRRALKETTASKATEDRYQYDRGKKRTIVQEQNRQANQFNQESHWIVSLQRIAAGDQTALVEFYEATSSLVFSLAFRIVKERTVAEDVVVEVYFQVWDRAYTYDHQRGTPLAWLFALTRSRAIDLLRARARMRTAEPLEHVSDIASPIPGPEELSAASERHRFVCRALESLTDEQRRVIELAYFSGLSHAAIAVALGQPLGTVKTRIRTGMMRLRELLTPLAPPLARTGQENPL